MNASILKNSNRNMKNCYDKLKGITSKEKSEIMLVENNSARNDSDSTSNINYAEEIPHKKSISSRELLTNEKVRKITAQVERKVEVKLMEGMDKLKEELKLEIRKGRPSFLQDSFLQDKKPKHTHFYTHTLLHTHNCAV